MESALGWLGDIIQWFGKFIPRIIIVRVTDKLIKFRYGNDIILCTSSNGIRGTGIHFYWPLVTEIEKKNVQRQPLEMPVQYLVTKDNKTVGVKPALIYSINDLEKFITKHYDCDSTLADIGSIAVKKYIRRMSYDDLLDTEEDLVEFELGIKIHHLRLTDFAPADIMGFWGMRPHIESGEE